ncbi:MAG: agmatinase family protein [Bacteroidota bacterium]|jgi:agmatinase
MGSKQDKIASFNPNNAGLADSQIYGLPFTPEESDIVLLPVPWEVTVSYGSGASEGPEHIFEASFQIDLFHPEFPELWKKGIAMLDASAGMHGRANALKEKAQQIIDAWEEGIDVENNDELQEIIDEINEACAHMVDYVEQEATKWMNNGKMVGLIGGDHSTPLGYLKALAKQHDSFGILHVDAHMDLRIAYEGFTYSHASIMYNALQIPQISKIVQVGIRDFCEEENRVVEEAQGRVVVHTDASIQRASFDGETWKQRCDAIIEALPEKVYVSFDIDGLDPTLCPNTGTPVPGGLTFQQATYLLSRLRDSKKIIGFDLVEVAPGDDDWNGNVGARLLFHLCGVAAI